MAAAGAAAQDGAIHALAPATLARVGAPRAAHASFRDAPAASADDAAVLVLPAARRGRASGRRRRWTDRARRRRRRRGEAAALDEALAEQLARLAAARAAAEADVAFLGTQGDALRADVAAGEAAREVLVAERPPRWRSRRPT